MATHTPTFRPGAHVRVLVGDGWYLAIVRAAFPQGSTSYAFPHYKVDMIGGERNVAVAMPRVSVDG